MNEGKHAAISKTGAGTLLIKSSLDKYFGTVAVEAGTMTVESAWNIKNAVTVAKGATLSLESFTIASADKSGNQDSKGNAIGGSLTINGTLSVKAGDTSSGSLTLNGGTLDAKNATTLNVGGVVVAGSDNTITLGENTNLSGSITLMKGSELSATLATAYTGASVGDDNKLVLKSTDSTDSNSQYAVESRLSFTGSTEGTLLITDTFTYSSGAELEALASLYRGSVLLNLKNATLAEGKTTTLVDGVIQDAAATLDTGAVTDSGKATATITTSQSSVGTGATTIVVSAPAGATEVEAKITEKSTLTVTGTEAGGAFF